MPDKPNIESKKNRKLVDRGWKLMSETLDAEMPVKRRRYMAAWIPLGAAAGILLLVLLTGTFQWGDHQPSADDESPSEQVLKEETHAASPDRAPNEDHPGVRSPKSVPGEAGPVQTEDASVNRSKNNRRATSAQNIRTRTLQAPEVKKDNNETVTPPERLSGWESHIAQHIRMQDKRPTDAPLADMREEISPFTPLHMGSSRLTRERETPVFEREKYRARRVGLEVFSAGHISDLLMVRGVEGGAAITYDIAPRMQLSAGVAYGYYANDGLARIGGADKRDLALESSQGFHNLYPGLIYTTYDLQNLTYDTASLLASNFHYLHLPVNVDYRINRSLELTGGVRISRLLSAPSDYDVAEVEDTGSLDPSGTWTANRSRSYLYDYDVLRKYDFSASIGLQWWFAEKWSLDVQYNHGFIPYIDRSDVSGRSDFNRSLSMGLRYRII